LSYYQEYYNLRSKIWDIPYHYVDIGLGILLFSFLLYIITLAPTVIWGDSAAFALQVKRLHLDYSADSHPLFIILGKLFSFLPFELAYSLNLLSAVSASSVVFLVYLIIYEITNSKISSIVGATALCVSHAFWLHAVIAEVYDLNAAFVAAVILLLLKWRKERNNYNLLYLAAFLFGLGLSNHRIMIFEIVGVIVFITVTEPRIFSRLKVMFSVLLSFFAGSFLLIYIFLRELPKKPVSNIADTLTAERYKEAFVKYSPKMFEEVGLYLAYLFYQFPLVSFLLGFAGIVALFRGDKKLALFFVLLIGVNALFFLKFGPSYGQTKYTFYISAYMVFSILIGCGFFSVQSLMRDKEYSIKKFSFLVIVTVFLLPVLLYNITPYVSKRLNIDLLHTRTVPYRDNEAFFLNPSKRGYTGAARYAQEALNIVSQGSIIIADYVPFTVLRYFQEINGVRRDVLILHTKDLKKNMLLERISAYYGKKDIYLADKKKRYGYKINLLQSEYELVPEGVLYRVVRKHR
jgi:hypothetical protein